MHGNRLPGNSITIAVFLKWNAAQKISLTQNDIVKHFAPGGTSGERMPKSDTKGVLTQPRLIQKMYASRKPRRPTVSAYSKQW